MKKWSGRPAVLEGLVSVFELPRLFFLSKQMFYLIPANSNY
jgi:hypothetical protein